MGLLDQFRQRKDKEKEKIEGHPMPPPAGHTLAEVMQDKNKSDLFLKLIWKDNGPLAMRLAKNKLEESDISLLEEKRKIFSEKIIQAEKVEKLLTKENVIDFARNHPDFEKIINLLGPEKAVKAIQSQLRELSVSDEEDRFNSIVHAMEEYDKYKNGEYKIVNDEVEKLCKDNKIRPQEYLDALAIKDPIEKEKALKKLATQGYGKFDKALNWLSRGYLSEDTVASLQSSENSLENSITQLDLFHKEIGAVLFSSISGNDSMRKALSDQLTNAPTLEKPKSGFMDARNETALNDAQFKADWETKKRKSNYGTRVAEQDAIRKEFLEEQKEAHRRKNKGKTGWYAFFMAILEAAISNKEGELK